MKRIMIIGCGGSGKSTMSRALHQKIQLPLYHLDRYFWLPNWVEIDKTKWQEINREIVAKDEWIIDGNYGSTMDMRLKRADTIIFLDRPWWIKVWRVYYRAWKHRGRSREDMTPGCNERVDWIFTKYIMFYNYTRKPGILKKLATLPKETQVFILKNDKAVARFLEEL